MLLVLAGLWLLGRNLGYFNDYMWEAMALFIPLALIAIGIEKIFTNSRLQFISYLTTIALVAAGLLLAFGASIESGTTTLFQDTTYYQRDDPDVDKVEAVFTIDRTNLTIRDSGEDLVWARFERFTRPPEIDYEVLGDQARVRMSSREHSYLGGAVKIQTDDPQEWRLRFSDRAPLTLQCHADQSDLHLNFATTPLHALNINAEDTRIYLKLGDSQPEQRVQISGAHNNLRLLIPQTVGLHIQGEAYSHLMEHLGLITADSGYSTPGYDTLSQHVIVELDSDFESLSIDLF